MNGILNTGLEFWQLLVAIITVVFGVVAIRVTLRFDVNQFLKSRRDSNIAKLRNTCTHLLLLPSDDGQIEVKSYFVSPPGTLLWQCQRCGLATYPQDGDFEKDAKYYLNNLKQYSKKNKRFHRLLKKGGLI